jgi:hypothetical protein
MKGQLGLWQVAGDQRLVAPGHLDRGQVLRQLDSTWLAASRRAVAADNTLRFAPLRGVSTAAAEWWLHHQFPLLMALRYWIGAGPP